MESEDLNKQMNKENLMVNKIETENKDNYQKDKYKKKGECPNFLLKLYQIYTILPNKFFLNITSIIIILHLFVN